MATSTRSIQMAWLTDWSSSQLIRVQHSCWARYSSQIWNIWAKVHTVNAGLLSKQIVFGSVFCLAIASIAIVWFDLFVEPLQLLERWTLRDGWYFREIVRESVGLALVDFFYRCLLSKYNLQKIDLMTIYSSKCLEF